MEYNNYKNPNAGCDVYGKPRLELAVYLKNNILNKNDYKYFIENGTLLGAYRNGKFIKKDDDFDFGILINSKSEIDEIYNYIKTNLSQKYKCRKVDTYCDKIEIFNPDYGKYNLLGPKYNNADYHYVTIDLQFYLYNSKENNYKMLYYINNVTTYKLDLILPLNKIELENEFFNSPNQTQKFLEHKYGSIDPNAKFSIKTGKYHLE
jgi:phosphorylcholine metabolism protein LicD